MQTISAVSSNVAVRGDSSPVQSMSMLIYSCGIVLVALCKKLALFSGSTTELGIRNSTWS